MRKLAIFLLFLVFLSLALTIVGLAIPSVGEMLHSIFVKTIGEGLATAASGAATNALLWASGLGLIGFGIFVLPPLVVGILIAGVVHQLWQKRPSFMGGNKPQDTTITLQTSPPPSPPQTIKLKPEEQEKVETAA